MQVYKTPLREFRFLLEDFLQLNNNKVLTDRSLEIDDLLMILEEASKMCEETLLPIQIAFRRVRHICLIHIEAIKLRVI